MIISFPDVARIRREKARDDARVEGSTTPAAARRSERRGTSDRRRSRQDELEDARTRETARRARHATVGGGPTDHRRMPPEQAAQLVEDIRRRLDRRPELVDAVSAHLTPAAGDRL
ncbi:hypothetical protein HN371_08725 [Candidatus Poribacteria bacterium]|jgi:hypothetical protein|nr:hypothetical protein [Candidatus Poribacteria bacterium]MBT5536141.1 hypothetical protein [Candidatus Poribacteria bacterium]MBT5711531.1 hypothetical protein [Candidatus Poribacteria bacterium]MBT7101563.1 hypothetical protein [Candidatus Poribacteria bacterium]MBT7804071.1 hypothetical protein [Candidatus Poribacteria bacterium]